MGPGAVFPSRVGAAGVPRGGGAAGGGGVRTPAARAARCLWSRARRLLPPVAVPQPEEKCRIPLSRFSFGKTCDVSQDRAARKGGLGKGSVLGPRGPASRELER